MNGNPEDKARNQTIIQEAVTVAQEKARINGLKINGTVAHPSDKMTYFLRAIRGNQAEFFLPGDYTEDGKPVVKVFPLAEVFDPNDAKEFALAIRISQILSAADNN